TISKISIFNGAGVLLGSSSTSPYNFIATNLLAGTYTFAAQATDANGVSVNSSPVTVTVNSNAPPVVSIKSPVNNGSYKRLSNIMLTASASGNGAPITKVDYYNGRVYLGTAFSSP